MEEKMDVGLNENSDESDLSEDEENEELLEQLIELDEKIQANENDYDSHIARINLLRQLQLSEKLDEARNQMHNVFPLTESLWKDWISDAKSSYSKEKLDELMLKSTEDYISPDLWCEYMMTASESVNTEEGIAMFRSVAEKAISNVGLHVKLTYKIFQLYIIVENNILDLMKPKAGQITTSNDEEDLIEQVLNISNIYKRQLSIPHIGMENTFKEYNEWFIRNMDGNLEKNFMDSYKDALKYLKEIQKYENGLKDSVIYAEYEPYKKYIEFEISRGDIDRVRCVYERAIVDNCLCAELWLDYLKYMKKSYKRGPILKKLFERSVRNVPGVSKIWQEYLLCLERSEDTVEDILEVFNKAYKCGFYTASDRSELLLTIATIMKRKYVENSDETAKEFLGSLDEMCTKHEEIVIESEEIDIHFYNLQSFRAYIEASINNDIEKCRKIFRNLMKNHNKAKLSWSYWDDWYHIEKKHGDVIRQRQVLHEAVKICASDTTDVDLACDRLLKFEREVGNCDEIYNSQLVIDRRMMNVYKRRERIQQQSFNKRKPMNKNKPDFKNKNDFKNNKNNFKNKSEYKNDYKKFVKEGDDKNSKLAKKRPQEDKQSPNTAKKSKISSEKPLNKEKQVSDDSFKAPAGLPPRFGKGKKSNQESPKKEKPDKIETETEKSASIQSCSDNLPAKADESCSVFVSNLSFDIKDVEETMKKFFKSCGEVTNVSVARSKNGKSRGFCFVSFKNNTSVELALKMDRQTIGGRPVYVSPNKQKEDRKNVFKYATCLEKNKLFVSGLSPNTTEDSLNDFFSKHGKLKTRARIAVNRAGQSKGIAYIEYENEKDASKAIMICDGSKLDGAAIQVAISNPPKRKNQDPDAKSRRTKLSFRGTINKSSQVEENSSNEIKTNEKKGNDFFANLFKKK